jgi:hypothetical protein
VIDWAYGTVVSVQQEREGYQELVISLEQGELARAIHYTAIGGRLCTGERVFVNTTAVRLGLGTGGYHFVVSPASRGVFPQAGEGHIMKLRYTPYQLRVLAVEEEAHPAHERMKEAATLEGIPVIAAELHSMVPAITATIGCLSGGKVRIAYVMTDGGALPLVFSRAVAELKSKGLLAGTVTVGHAFGGDLEAVNLYSGLLAARHVLRADVIVVAMGPGVVGTGTMFGHTGIEQGQVLNAVHSLGGRPIACLRMSFADGRERHRGVSHHSLTALSRVALKPVWVALPLLETQKAEQVESQLRAAGILRKHRMVTADGSVVKRAAERYNVSLKTMGRSLEEDPEFFLSCGAAGLVAWGFCKRRAFSGKTRLPDACPGISAGESCNL